MILCEKIEFKDLILIDSKLYHFFKNLKENIKNNKEIDDNNDIIKNLGLDYSIEKKYCNNQIH